MNGCHTDYNSRTTNLKIKSVDGTASFELIGVKLVPQLPVTASSMAVTEALKHFEHLCDIKLPDASYSSIHILIGSIVPDFFVVNEQRIGASCEPYAQRFLLGCAVIGPLNASLTEAEVSSVILIFHVSDSSITPKSLTALKCASKISPGSA